MFHEAVLFRRFTFSISDLSLEMLFYSPEKMEIRVVMAVLINLIVVIVSKICMSNYVVHFEYIQFCQLCTSSEAEKSYQNSGFSEAESWLWRFATVFIFQINFKKNVEKCF